MHIDLLSQKWEKRFADFSPAPVMKFIAFTLPALLLAVSANAQTVLQSQNFTFIPSGSSTVSFDKFDTMGGTRILQGVAISSSFIRTGGSLAIDNDSSMAGTILLTHQVSGLITGSVPLLNASFGAVIDSTAFVASISTSTVIGGTIGDPTSTFNSTNSVDYYNWDLPDSQVSATGEIGSLFWSNYTGTGTYDLTFTGNQSVTATGTSGLQQAITVSSLTGNITVNYTYTVVPEASTALLSIVAASGLMLRRRRN
jgi:hypothetical protein